MTAIQNKSATIKEKADDSEEPADFDKAINEAGFGLFNLILVFMAIPAKLSNVYSTTTMAYILPIAECDLKLSLFHKGVLNAVTYGGMISSAIIWGYLADTQGRRKLLVVGYLADAVCVFCSSLSQNFAMLATFKFLGGLILNGPTAVLVTYLTELHGSNHRSRVLMAMGMMMAFGNLTLPILVTLILPRDWEFILFESFNVHTWQIFLFFCGLPSLTSGLILIILPESPKFLMSQGRNAEALKSFRKIYYFNTRKPKDTYPIRRLIEEVPNRSKYSDKSDIFNIENKQDKISVAKEQSGLVESLREGWQQMKPMFHKPLLWRTIHVYLIQFFMFLGINTIRLWLPQLFASISEYETEHANDTESSNLCTILDYSVNKTANNVQNYDSLDCNANRNVSVDMYLNNIIVAVVGIIGFGLAGFVVRILGPKRILVSGLLSSGALGLSLYWSNNGLTTLIISSIFIAISGISGSSLMGITVSLFPTSLRTIIVSVSLMSGRLGALCGNMLFPLLVEIGCIPPFIMVGAVLIIAGALACILPSEKNTTFT